MNIVTIFSRKACHACTVQKLLLKTETKPTCSITNISQLLQCVIYGLHTVTLYQNTHM